MFKNLQETIKALNADVKNVSNCEKAKKLRRKLIGIGLPMAIIGGIGMMVGTVLFMTLPFGTLPFVMIMLFLCAILLGIGVNIASLGFKIVVTGYTSNLIDETVGNNCPNCGETINPETQFCSKCGTKVKKECPKCKHINSHKSEFCEKCGTKLD